MRILWLTNIKPPIISKLEGEKVEAYGGWITQFAERINDKHDVAYVYPGERRICKTFDKKDTVAYEFVTNCRSNCGYFIDIINDCQPDIIHIWGTEYLHTREMVEACEITKYINRTIISIQGLVSVYSIHYYAGVPISIINKKTIRDYIRNQSIKKSKNNCYKQGLQEVYAIKKVKNVIGRTTWDRVCTQVINSDIKYFKCNESLRESFYKNRWDYKKCLRRSIVLSQGHYPIKGLHILIEAMRLLKEEYKDLRLYVAGNDIVNCSIKHKSYYGVYISKLIKKYALTDNISFVGVIDECKMRDLMMDSNVFVNCSSIENSSNSIGEAMLLGMPVVCSNVGGTSDFIKHGESGFLYPYDEYYMLYHYIKRIFDDDVMAQKIGVAAHDYASKIYDVETNIQTIQEIYCSVLRGE